MRSNRSTGGIGQLRETHLHEQLKQLYAQDAAASTEVEFMGFIVDVLLPERIVEIQTRGLGRLRRKIEHLAPHRPIRIVHPIAIETTINKLSESGELLASRRSPKRGRIEDAFREVAPIADLLMNPAVSLEVVLVRAVEVRVDDGMGSWRRKGVSIVARHLGAVDDSRVFRSPGDFVALLPAELPDQFTNRDLMDAAGLRYAQAQPMTRALAKMNQITTVSHRGRERVYGRPLQA